MEMREIGQDTLKDATVVRQCDICEVLANATRLCHVVAGSDLEGFPLYLVRQSSISAEFGNADKVLNLYSMSWSEMQKQHPFTAGVVDERAALAARGAKFAAAIDHLRYLYMQAMVEMKGMTAYPDANSTLRFSYGNVLGYNPREAEFRTPFTTLRGMIEKDTGENPFDAPQKLIDLQNARDFGRYGSDNTVALNFLSTTDIIGGNSGSPILNGKGEQVGLCFDGNFEGLGNDFYYDPAVNRTISVDIRYVLFVVEKFGGAKWIVDEMKLVGGPKANTGSAVAYNKIDKLEKQDDRLLPTRRIY